MATKLCLSCSQSFQCCVLSILEFTGRCNLGGLCCSSCRAGVWSLKRLNDDVMASCIALSQGTEWRMAAVMFVLPARCVCVCVDLVYMHALMRALSPIW